VALTDSDGAWAVAEQLTITMTAGMYICMHIAARALLQAEVAFKCELRQAMSAIARS
jgi:hypothetical protein